MINIWEILEIEPTTDIKTIKKAYIVLSKKYHPEDDIEQFSLIKRAYDEAIKLARKNKDTNQSNNLFNNSNNENKNYNQSNLVVDIDIEEKKEDLQKQYHDVKLDISNQEKKIENPNYQFNLNYQNQVEENQSFIKEISKLPVVPVNKKGDEKEMVIKWRNFLESDDFSYAMKDEDNLKSFVYLVKKIESKYQSCYYHVAVTCVARYIDHPTNKDVAQKLKPYFKKELKERSKNRRTVLILFAVLIFNLLIILL